MILDLLYSCLNSLGLPITTSFDVISASYTNTTYLFVFNFYLNFLFCLKLV